MSVSGNKHSFLRQSGNLTFKGWIIIFFEGKLLQNQIMKGKPREMIPASASYYLCLTHKLLPTKQGRVQP